MAHYAAPVCTPSRVSLLTGRHFSNLGVFTPFGTTDVPDLNKRHKFLSEYLKECCGYATYAIGKVI